MADGGAINLRLSLKGAEQVRAELAKLGPEGSRAMRELDRGMRQPTAGLMALDQASGQVRNGLDDLAHRGGAAGGVLAQMGPWGLAAAAGLGAMVLAIGAALNQARQAMDFADALDDASRRIHINVEALQTWRFAADEFGASAADADQALGAFMRKFGEAQSNLSPRAMRPFAALGFSREDLQNFRSGEEALEEVIRRIAELGDASEQAAVAERLGLGPMLPVIRQGAEEIARVRDEARQLGVVMDQELVQRAAQSQREFEILSQVIDVQLKSAFVDLAPALVQAINLVAQLATALSDAMDAWRQLDERTDRGLRRRDAELARAQTGLIERYGSRENMDGRVHTFGSAVTGRVILDAGQNFDAINAERMRIAGLLTERADRDRTPPATGTGSLVDTGGGGRDNSAAEARKAEQRRRALEDLALELDLEEARASRNQELVRTLERQREERQLTRRLEDLGVSQAEIASRIEERRTRQAAMRAEQEARVTREIEGQLTSEVARIDEAFSVEREQDRNRELERRIEIYQRIYDLAEATRRAEADQALVDDARARAARRWLDQAAEAHALELARLSGDRETTRELERQNWLRERSLELQRQGRMLPRQADEQAQREWMEREHAIRRGHLREGIREFLEGVRRGDLEGFFETLADRFASRLEDQLADQLMPLFEQLAQMLVNALSSGGKGKGGFADFAAQVIGSFMGGGSGGFTSSGSFGPGSGVSKLVTSGANGGGPFTWNSAPILPAPSYGAAAMGLPVEPSMKGAASPGITRIEVRNLGSEKLTAQARPTADGGLEIDLRPMFRGMLAEAGADGSLSQAARLTPSPRRRG